MYHPDRRAVDMFGSGPRAVRFHARKYLFRGYADESFVDADKLVLNDESHPRPGHFGSCCERVADYKINVTPLLRNQLSSVELTLPPVWL